MSNTENQFNAVKVLSFINHATGDKTNLTLGFKNNKPYYRISSKTIPITGEFTGYPTHVMTKWLKDIGYTFLGEFNLGYNLCNH